MLHLLEVISSSLGRFVQRKLSNLDVRSEQFGQVRTSLQDGRMVYEKWSSAAEILTTQFWRHCSTHPWKGGSFASPTLSQLVHRSEEV